MFLKILFTIPVDQARPKNEQAEKGNGLSACSQQIGTLIQRMTCNEFRNAADVGLSMKLSDPQHPTK